MGDSELDIEIKRTNRTDSSRTIRKARLPVVTFHEQTGSLLRDPSLNEVVRKTSGGGRMAASVERNEFTIARRYSQVANRGKDRLDGGYAWVICFAVCMMNITTDGFCFTLNILFPIFLETFGDSTATTSLIGSILTGVMLLSGEAREFDFCNSSGVKFFFRSKNGFLCFYLPGPMVGFAVSRIGVRVVCVVGALLAGAGVVISAMANSVFFLVISLGLLTGNFETLRSMTLPFPLDQYILKELNVSIILFFLEL